MKLRKILVPSVDPEEVHRKRDYLMETFDELQARHKREQRHLQNRMTQKKKNATKKARKGVNSECEDLERQLKEKHKQEIAALDGNPNPHTDDTTGNNSDSLEDSHPTSSTTSDKDPVNELADDVSRSSISEPHTAEDGEPRKRNRQKERLARRAAEQEAAAIAAEAEAAKLPNWKSQERTSMLKAFKENGLVEKEIAPDGHCLFSAVADQLSEAGIPLVIGGEDAQAKDGRYKVVRKRAARYIEGHPEEFAGFLDEPLGAYVHKIRDTAEWGGQLELIALAKSYNVEICVLQDGRTDRFEPGSSDAKEAEKIWLAYYRHGYGLGEHYNSLRRTP